MAHRVNVMLDDEAWRVVSSLPRGLRSQFISRAVVATAGLEQRRRAAEHLARLRRVVPTPPKSAEELVRELRDGA
jgi:hypothetical protein